MAVRDAYSISCSTVPITPLTLQPSRGSWQDYSPMRANEFTAIVDEKIVLVPYR